ncbi:MAG TPA: 4Fe-4S binding protein [Planctomycetota bacterium]
MADSTLKETVQQAEKFWVVPELCIACDACCQDFPEVFYMGSDQKAHAHEQHQWDLYNARTVVDVCPTSAIKFSGELPPPEEAGKLEEVPGWELQWADWRGVEEDVVERDRRYGRDFSITEHAGYTEIVYRFPTRVPAVQNRFKFGLPETMPLYRSHVQLSGKTLLVAGWLTDPKVRALTHTSSSFPAQFVNRLELERDYLGMAQRYDAHATLTIVLFTDPVVQETWKWKSHFITEKCTACTICERVCPTNAITSGEIFYIDPDLCINCSVCGVYCPFDAIDDNRDVTVARIKAKQIPKAVVHEELCTGCEFCVDVCPFEALEMRAADPRDAGKEHLPQTAQVAYVIEKNCVSCKLCEQVCIKDAIEVPRQHQFEDIGMSFMHYVTDNH